MLNRASFSLLVPFVVAGLSACSGPSVEVLDRPVDATSTGRAFTSSTALEPSNRETLRDEKLLRAYNRDRETAIDELLTRYREEPTIARELALAEMSSDYADILSKDQRLAAIGRYLDAAWLSKDEALAEVRAGSHGQAKLVQDYVSARIVRLIREMDRARGHSIDTPGALGPWKIQLARGHGKVDPRDYDLVVPSNWLKTDGIKWRSITQDGLGVAMVGHTKATPERRAADPQMPVAGRGYPLNGRVVFDGNRADIILQDLMVKATGPVGGDELPLSANFSSAVSFSYYDKVRRMKKIGALLRPAEFADTMGLFSFRPYDSDRIPLVLVHGLMSSAEAWYPFINLLLADEVVRQKYQILVFNYPSGVPVSKSAFELRSALEAYRTRHDPSGTEPLMDRMVILGHSMGGIISNAQIRTSGDRVYDAVFTKDIDELGLSGEEVRSVEDLLYFEANPNIERAILLAAPLRGSAFATNRIGQLGANLIRLPFNLVDTLFGQIAIIDALTDVGQQMSQRPKNSVTSLRPDNPLLGAILSCPVPERVRIHSIIAQKHPDDPKEEGSDGYVEYPSAHLDEAVSEIIVMKADHRGMVNREETVNEVCRILRLHVGRD